MFDPDPQRSILRLGAEPLAKPLTTSERLALAEAEMEEAIKRWVSVTVDYAAERAQARPISAARDGNVRF